jgi:hypothetical protein
LDNMGFISEFVTCDIKCEGEGMAGDDDQWSGVQFKYFEGDSYYLPIVNWAPGHPIIQEEK